MTMAAILTSHSGGGVDPALWWQWTLVALIANPALLLIVVRRARQLLQPSRSPVDVSRVETNIGLDDISAAVRDGRDRG